MKTQVIGLSMATLLTACVGPDSQINPDTKPYFSPKIQPAYQETSTNPTPLSCVLIRRQETLGCLPCRLNDCSMPVGWEYVPLQSQAVLKGYCAQTSEECDYIAFDSADPSQSEIITTAIRALSIDLNVATRDIQVFTVYQLSIESGYQVHLVYNDNLYVVAINKQGVATKIH